MYASSSVSESGLTRYYSNVFLVMAIGLAITGAVTLSLSHSQDMMKTLFGLYTYVEDGKNKTGFTASMWWWIASVVELLLVIGMSWGTLGKSMSVGASVIMFALYSALNGVTLAPAIYAYTDASVAMVFFITAGTFGACALFGYVTKINLLPMSGFFLIGLIGLLVALVVNFFFHSPAIDFAISGSAVLLFAGLTAYDMQKLREMYSEASDDDVPRLVVYGALTLYLDFINMFIHLLRIFGVKKD